MNWTIQEIKEWEKEAHRNRAFREVEMFNENSCRCELCNDILPQQGKKPANASNKVVESIGNLQHRLPVGIVESPEAKKKKKGRPVKGKAPVRSTLWRRKQKQLKMKIGG